MLKTLSLLTLTAFISSAYGMSDAELGKAMRAELDKTLVTVKAPKLIFHWVDASDVNPSGQYNTEYPSTAPHFKTYVEKQGKRIYNRRNRGDSDIAGPGLYSGLISEQQIKDPAIKAMSAAQVKSFSQKYAFGCTP